MFERCDEIKVLRDPIHGYVNIKLKVVWDCLNAKEFQRLRRIRQLGGAYMAYHTAEHTRFAHSLGVYEIVRKMVEENRSIREALSEIDKVTVMLAGLLHDLGHGPYSHSFELISPFRHEEMTIRMIRGQTEVHAIMENALPGLAERVAQVIEGTHENSILIQMISGQLDADRMDYLLRDAYFTGTKYGEFDIQRVLRTIRVRDGKLVVKQSGMHSVEDYIMARYHMYWQVYYHPVARCYELLMKAFFMRLQDLAKKDVRVLDRFLPFAPIVLHQPITIEQHVAMDEPCFNYGLALYQTDEDPILADLAGRIVNRRLFGYEDRISEAQSDFLRARLIQAGYDPRYYLLSDEARQRPYVPYKGDQKSMIYVVTPQEEVCELSEVSVIVSALIRGKAVNDNKLYFPKELLSKARD